MRSGSAKPNVSELGPFSYREVRVKQNIVQVEETISYGSYIAYEFDREASCEECEFHTNVTVINPVIVMIDWALENVRDLFFMAILNYTYKRLSLSSVSESDDWIISDLNTLSQGSDTDINISIPPARGVAQYRVSTRPCKSYVVVLVTFFS